ncbi:MAG: tRNA dihydrouridine(20/20a) synthase DusA [Gammaproteobacteria bacterium]
MQQTIDRKLCVAPMMTHTDRHFRYLLRLISSRVMLYTEMITGSALIHGNADKHLRFNRAEHPVGIQLGGNNAAELARCARLAEQYGYDEINLNVGCPSDRVKSGMFGACLMLQPQTVADCVKAMQDTCALPVTVKTRIGVDQQDSYEQLAGFVETVAAAGCHTFIIHARKAWLSGLSPRQNRTVPPLMYERVYQIKQDFPQLEIIINGGIDDLQQCKTHLQQVDGVMAGRAVCHNPWLLATADQEIFACPHAPRHRAVVIRDYMEYIQQQLQQGETLHAMSRHILGLYQGQRGARAFRRYLSEHAHKRDSGVKIIEKAVSFIQAV